MCFWSLLLTNNDILRRLRYTFNFNDKKMVEIFALADFIVTREQVAQWLKKEDDEGYVNCTDQQLAAFLNGFINEKRGKRAGEQAKPEKKLTNNLILTKLKIALNLKAEDIIELLQQVDFRIGKAELSAFFRKPDHRHYRQCKDQFLRNFLKAIQEKFYVERSKKIDFSAKTKAKEPNKATHHSKKAVTEQKTIKPKTAKKLYLNPKISLQEQTSSPTKQTSRKTLTLKPEDIWKN